MRILAKKRAHGAALHTEACSCATIACGARVRIRRDPRPIIIIQLPLSAAILLLTCWTPSAWAGGESASWTYDFRGTEVALEIVPNAVAMIEANTPRTLLSAAPRERLERAGFTGVEIEPSEYAGLKVARWRDRQGAAAHWLDARDALFFGDGIGWVAPILRYDRAIVIPKPEIWVELANATPIESIAELHQLGVIRHYDRLGATYLLEYSGTPAGLFRCCRDLVKDPRVAWAHPNFIFRLEKFAVPNDPLFPLEWRHQNTGQTGGTPGADVGSVPAWDITTGAANVVIAVLDEGVNVDHPDLAANMVPGYDATNAPPPGGILGNADPTDPHGTHCAGVAAARGDNGIGIAGIAYTCKIMPVRIGYGSYWTEPAWVVDGVTWAVDNGADVLSNSWGGGPPTVIEENAMIYATTQGRSGRGSPVVFAAGNANDDSVAYPAAYPACIAVGATSPCDERKSPTSCDGMTFWGSNYGAALDLVAPGVLFPSTDIAGGAGAEAGDTIGNFWGTSAACPIVAGGIALLLSVSPQLSQTAVRDLLAASAADGVGLAAEDTPGWDPYMGAGRLDVAQLLALAPAGDFVRGDVNWSGVPLDLADATQALAYLFQGGPLSCLDAADANDSGTVDIADPVFILNYLFALGPAPPAPFPALGPDPTSDLLTCGP